MKRIKQKKGINGQWRDVTEGWIPWSVLLKIIISYLEKGVNREVTKLGLVTTLCSSKVVK